MKELDGAITVMQHSSLLAPRAFYKGRQFSVLVLKGTGKGGISSPRPHGLLCQSKGESLGHPALHCARGHAAPVELLTLAILPEQRTAKTHRLSL